MESKNSFLPLIQQRNRKKIILMQKSAHSIQQRLSPSILKNYHASFNEGNFKLLSKMQEKDYEAIKLVQKYVDKNAFKKKIKEQVEQSLKSENKQENTLFYGKSSKTLNKALSKQQKKGQIIRIKTLTSSNQNLSTPLKINLELIPSKKLITQMTYDEMKQVKSLLFSKQKRKASLRARAELLEKYQFLKSKASNSLSNNLKVYNYDSGRKKQVSQGYFSDKKLSRIPDSSLSPQKQTEENDIYQKSYRKLLEKTKYRYNPQLNVQNAEEISPIRYKQKKYFSENSQRKFSQRCRKIKYDSIDPWTDQIPEQRY